MQTYGGGFTGGGGTTSTFKLGDLGHYKDAGDFYPITSATLVAINIALALARSGTVGTTVNTYFTNFGLEGVLSNLALVMILFQVTRWGYSTFYSQNGAKAWSPLVFIAILVSVQLLHDVLFYYGAVRVLPSGVNEMVDTLKGYAAENGGRALGGHSLFLVVTAVLAMLLKESGIATSIFITVAALYLLPYLISMASPAAKRLVTAATAKAATAAAAAKPVVVSPTAAPAVPAVPVPTAFSGDAWGSLR